MSRGPILVVDDDPTILRMVTEILAEEEYAVSTAPNGARAIEVVEQEQPGLVLLDMRMPVLDGWGFAHALRERSLSIPIVVMTAATDSRRWAAEIGAADCLPKPFDLLDLLATVERLYGTP